jgi:hypothetical protein
MIWAATSFILAKGIRITSRSTCQPPPRHWILVLLPTVSRKDEGYPYSDLIEFQMRGIIVVPWLSCSLQGHCEPPHMCCNTEKHALNTHVLLGRSDRSSWLHDMDAVFLLPCAARRGVAAADRPETLVVVDLLALEMNMI